MQAYSKKRMIREKRKKKKKYIESEMWLSNICVAYIEESLDDAASISFQGNVEM